MELHEITERMRHNPAWVDFQKYLFLVREEWLTALRNADDGRIREISGRIQAYDDLLAMTGWQIDQLFKKTE
jgi:hypothetical protein